MLKLLIWTKCSDRKLSYLRQECNNVFFSFFRYVGDPVKDGLKHGVLLSHIEVVSFKDVCEFLQRELHELFIESNLLKVINDITVGLALQFRGEAGVGEVPDADAVLWAELLPQEVAAGLYNVHYIELISCNQQVLCVVLRHRNRASVCKLNDELHHVRSQAGYVEDLFVWG